jgi:hypothetical protein
MMRTRFLNRKKYKGIRLVSRAVCKYYPVYYKRDVRNSLKLNLIEIVLSD